MPSKYEIGKELRVYLVSNKVCIKAFAREMRVSRSTLYNWFEGKGMLDYNYKRLIELLYPNYKVNASSR